MSNMKKNYFNCNECGLGGYTIGCTHGPDCTRCGTLVELAEAPRPHDSSGSAELALLKAELAAMEEKMLRYESAIKWALGEIGEFPTRKEGDGAYWWRNKLRKCAGF